MLRRDKPAADNWFPDADFAGRRVHVLEYDRPGSGDDDAVTGQSIGLMQRLANRDTGTAAVSSAAQAIAAQLGSNPTPKQLADAIFAFCARTVTYQHEEDMKTQFSDLKNFAYDQTLIPPAALLAMPRPSGDCVDFSMLALALCRLYSIPAVYKTIAADKTSSAYSHVYVMAQTAPGRFYALDTSNGPGPGFEFALPAGKKEKLWPDPADLARKPMIHTVRRQARLGDLSTDAGSGEGPEYDGVPPGSQTGYEYPAAGGSGGWTRIATTIIDDATRIAAPLVRQSNIQAPYYIAGANGAQILYDPSTGKTANAGSAAARTPAVLSQNLLIAAAIGAVALFAFSSSQRK